MKRSVALLATLCPLLVVHCARPEASATAPAGESLSPEGHASGQKLTVPTDNPGATVRAFGNSLRAQFANNVRINAEARVPMHANEAFTLNQKSGKIAVTPIGAKASSATVENGIVHYKGAFGGNTDMLQKLTQDGTEDYVRFETQPASESLSYRVDLTDAVVSLRHFGGVVEFLDKDGTPVFRMNQPYGIDAEGKSFPVKVAVGGCAVDTDPRGPWGRELPRAGADHCTINLDWSGSATYPMTIDPAWTSATSMAANNISHEMLMTKLTGGKVLVVNGGLSTELFDPATDSWAATGAPATAGHRSRIVSVDGDKAVLAHYNNFMTYSLGAGTWTAPIGAPSGTDGEGVALAAMGGSNVLVVQVSGKTRVFDAAAQTFSADKANGAFPNGPLNIALFPLGNNKYAFNGHTLPSLRIYDSAADSWAVSAAGANLAGDANCGSVIALGGNKVLSYSQDGQVNLVDIVAGTSVAVPKPGTYFQTAYLCARTADVSMGGGKYLFSGGRFTYDANANTIADNGAFPSGAAFHGAIVKLNDGRYLAAGGNASFSAYLTADIYAPNAQADCALPSAFATAATPVFNSVKPMCSACDGDNAGATALKCPDAATPACQTAGALMGQCTACSATNETTCTGVTPRCDTAAGTCAGCNGGLGEAGKTRACNGATKPACKADGSCIAATNDFGFAGAVAPCPTAANPYAKADGSCGKCTSNADCAGATHTGLVCNIAAGSCGNSCATNSDCKATEFCDTAGAKVCTPKKADGATCAVAAECTTGTCTAGKCGAPATTDAGTSGSSGKTDSGTSGSSGKTDAGTSGSSGTSGTSGSSGDAGTCDDCGGSSSGCAVSSPSLRDNAATGASFLLVAAGVVASIRRKRNQKDAR